MTCIRPSAPHLDAELDRQYRGDRAADPRRLATLVAGRVRRTGRHHGVAVVLEKDRADMGRRYGAG